MEWKYEVTVESEGYYPLLIQAKPFTIKQSIYAAHDN